MCHCRLFLQAVDVLMDVSLSISASDHAGTELSPVCEAVEYLCNLRESDDLRDMRARCQCKRAAMFMFIRGQLVGRVKRLRSYGHNSPSG